MGIRSGEASVAAGAAAVLAPSGPDCGGARRWRGQGDSGGGGGEREGAEEGRSWSAKAGRGEVGEESLWQETAREGDEAGGGERGECMQGPSLGSFTLALALGQVR